jgi:hypothetical protein
MTQDLFKELRERTHNALTLLWTQHGFMEAVDDGVAIVDRCAHIDGALLEKMGCAIERSHIPGLISVDVPPAVSLAVLRPILDEGEAQERWGDEEACLASTYQPIGGDSQREDTIGRLSRIMSLGLAAAPTHHAPVSHHRSDARLFSMTCPAATEAATSARAQTT